MSIETQEQLDGMRAAGAVVARALAGMPRAAHPGVSTAELDAVAATVFRDAGARSGPQLDYDFPGVTCISVNNEAIHGIPGPRPLRSGDLVKLDVTAELNGFYADAQGGTVDAGYNGFSNAQHTNYLGMSAPTTDPTAAPARTRCSRVRCRRPHSTWTRSASGTARCP